MKPQFLLPALLALPLVTACGKAPQPTPDSQTQNQPETLLGQIVAEKIDGVRRELQDSALLIGGGEGIRFSISANNDIDAVDTTSDITALPLLELSANGEVIINQQKIQLSPEQQQLTARYHRQVLDIADAGLAIAVGGADLGGNALIQAAGGFLRGKSSAEIEAEIKAQAEKFKTQARSLCQQIGGLVEIQNQMAESLPQFADYAVVTPDSAEKCLKDLEENINLNLQ